MNKSFLIFGAVAGFLGVIAGAMLSHQLRSQMPPLAQEVYETGVRYQFYHVFALLAAGIIYERFPVRWIRYSGTCFITGILLFSGSLYIISAFLTNNSAVPSLLGLCTPLGGLAFILGWIFLGTAIWKSNRS